MTATSPKTPGENLETTFPLSGPSRIEWEHPTRIALPLNWAGHIPFAFWLVEAAKPRTLVELGVHSGNSYCAFLQAIRALGLSTRCTGIDHWGGDSQTGFYEDAVYNELRAWHDPQYQQWSKLLRSSFDDAVSSFADSSIDLLHIDGLHTYEAVARDFNTWLPKMSARGIVLLHDTTVRDGDFGVWRLWEEIAARFPAFAFAHSNGLGVVYVGTEPLEPGLQALFTPDERVAGQFRTYFSRLGNSILDQHAHEEQRQRAEALQGELGQARARIGQLLEEADEQRHQRELLKIEIEQQSVRLNHLGRQERELEIVKASSSWRLTWPLRAAGRMVHGLMRKTGRGTG